MPDDLRSQFPIVREIADDDGHAHPRAGGLRGRRRDRHAGRHARRRAGVDTYIVSGDLDGLQLVNDHVRLLTTRMGVGRHRDLRRRRGSWSDTACAPTRCSTTRRSRATPPTTSPACRGWGRRRRSSLLQQFGTLDALYERLDEVKGKLRDRLAEHRESAFLSRQIGRIVTDLPVELNLDERGPAATTAARWRSASASSSSGR